MNEPHRVKRRCLAACPSEITDCDCCGSLLPVALLLGPSPFPHPLNGRELVVLVTEDF